MASNCSLLDSFAPLAGSIRIRAPLTRDDESSSSEVEYSNLKPQFAKEYGTKWSDRRLGDESDYDSFDSGEESDMESERKFDEEYGNGNIERFPFDKQMRCDVLHAEGESRGDIAVGKGSSVMEYSLKESSEHFRPVAQLSFDDEITDDYGGESESEYCCSAPSKIQVVGPPLRVKLMDMDGEEDEDEDSDMESTGKQDLFVLSQYEAPIVSGSETESIGMVDDIAIPSTDCVRNVYVKTPDASLDQLSVLSDLQGDKTLVFLPNDFMAEYGHIIEEKARSAADFELIEAVFLDHSPVEAEMEGLSYETSATDSFLQTIESSLKGSSKKDEKGTDMLSLSTITEVTDQQSATSEDIKDVREPMVIMNKLEAALDNCLVSRLNKLVLETVGNSINEYNLQRDHHSNLNLEIDKNADFDVSVNILMLGKPGVGKSAIINAVFGENKVIVNPFEPGTRNVNVISGTVNGVNIRFVDTPGLRSPVNDHAMSRRTLSRIKKISKTFPPDVVLYVDRLDCHSRDLEDLPLLRLITDCLSPSVWRNCIVTLTHASSPLPDDHRGSPLEFDLVVTQRSNVIQQAISQCSLLQQMMPVFVVENHDISSKQEWRTQLLRLCYSWKILAELSSTTNHNCSASLPSFISSLMPSSCQSKNNTKLEMAGVYTSMQRIGSMYFGEKSYDDFQDPQLESKTGRGKMERLNLMKETRRYVTPLSELNLQASIKDHRSNNLDSSPLVHSRDLQQLSINEFSLMSFKSGQGVVASVESLLPVRRTSIISIRAKLNEKPSGQISIKTTNSDLHIVFIAAVHLILSICKNILT